MRVQLNKSSSTTALLWSKLDSQSLIRPQLHNSGLLLEKHQILLFSGGFKILQKKLMSLILAKVIIIIGNNHHLFLTTLAV
jgi:hypothetical protein